MLTIDRVPWVKIFTKKVSNGPNSETKTHIVMGKKLLLAHKIKILESKLYIEMTFGPK